MKHPRYKSHNGRFIWVILRELHSQLKGTCIQEQYICRAQKNLDKNDIRGHINRTAEVKEYFVQFY